MSTRGCQIPKLCGCGAFSGQSIIFRVIRKMEGGKGVITVVVGFCETLRDQSLWSFSLEETHTDAHLNSTSISFEDLKE